MTLLEAIALVIAGDAQRIAQPGQWRVYRSGEAVMLEHVDDGWTPRMASPEAQA